MRHGTPFGVAGDFITAPEVSQMFGELIGTWFRSIWQNQDAPASANLVEFGPGRGTLMADILRVVRHDPVWARIVSVHLVETSPHLKALQQEALAASGFDIQWHARFETVPSGPCFVVANEFFDAIPFRQFIYNNTNWAERVIGLDATEGLAFGLVPTQMNPGDHGLDLPEPHDGQILEISPQRGRHRRRIGLSSCGLRWGGTDHRLWPCGIWVWGHLSSAQEPQTLWGPCRPGQCGPHIPH